MAGNDPRKRQQRKVEPRLQVGGVIGIDRVIVVVAGGTQYGTTVNPRICDGVVQDLEDRIRRISGVVEGARQV